MTENDNPAYVTDDGPTDKCKNCGRPVVYAEEAQRWLHYVSGIAPCSVWMAGNFAEPQHG